MAAPLSGYATDPGVRAAFALLVDVFRAPARLRKKLGLARSSVGGSSSFAIASAAVSLFDAGPPSDAAEHVQLAVLEVLMAGGTPRLEDAVRKLAGRIALRHVGAVDHKAAPSLRAELAMRAELESRARSEAERAAAHIDAGASLPTLMKGTLAAAAVGIRGRG